MADADDLQAVHDGDHDLVGRDLREADLSGMDLSNRDFSRSKLRGVNFSRANLQGATFDGVDASGATFLAADLSDASWRGGAHEVIFDDADLRGVNFNSLIVRKCMFRRTNLVGASFVKANFEVVDFTDAIVDESTNFDGAFAHRSLAAQDAFRHYHVERGVLRRILPGKRPAVSSQQIADEIDRLLWQLDRVGIELREGAPPPGIGHNNPPEETPIDRGEYDDLRSVLVTARAQVVAPTSSAISAVRAAADRLENVGLKISRWVAAKANIFADSFAKGLGQALSSRTVLVSGWLALTGQMDKVWALLEMFAKALPGG